MRLHTLELQNINALAGEHVVDFEALFDASPIILIAGETGAGKSSILDAICLALYGVTPRLLQTAQSKRRSESVSHVMTRGTGSCGATLTFSVRSEDGARERYRASWSLRRAHGRPNGNIQAANTSLERWDEAADAWEDVVASGRHASVEEGRAHALRGMELDDFLRAVMLAQGQFDSLLGADDKARIEALRRIVPVDEIEAIGRAVAERNSEEATRLRELEATLQAHGSQRLDDETRAAHEQRLLECQAALKSTQSRIDALDARVRWQTTATKLDEERLRANEKVAHAREAQAAGAALRASLDEHRRLDDAARALEELRARREALTKHRAHAAELATKLEADKAALQPTRDAETKAAAHREALQKAREERKPALERAEEAWTALTHARSQEQSRKEAHARAIADRDAQQERVTSANSRSDALQAELATAQERLRVFAWDDAELPERATLSAGASALRESLAEHARAHAKVEEVEKEQRGATSAHTNAGARLREVDARVAAWTNSLRALAASAALPLDDTPSFQAVGSLSEALELKREAITERGTQLGQLAERVEELEKLLDQLATTREATAAAKKAHAEALESQKQRAAEKREADARLEDIQKLHATQQELLRMVELLKSDAPCPVCGAADHPPVDSRRDELQRELADTRTKLEASTAACQNATAALEKATDAASNLRLAAATNERDLERLEGEATPRQTACREAAQALGLIANDAPLPKAEALKMQLAQLREDFVTMRGWGEQLRALDAEARSLQSDRTRESAALEAATRDAQRLDAQRKAAVEARDAAEEARRAGQARADAVFEAPALQRFAPAKAGDAPAQGEASVAALQQLIERLEDFEKQRVAVTALAPRIKDAADAHANEQKQLEARSAAVAAATEALDSATTATAARVEASQAHFNGEEPRLVAQRFHDELEAAVASYEQAREALQRANAALQALEREHSDAQAVVKTKESELQEREASFKNRLTTLELEDEAQIDARRLDPESAAHASTRIAELDSTLREATAVLSNVSERHAAHQQAKEKVGEPTPTDSEDLAAAKAEEKSFLEEGSRIQTLLEADAELRATQSELAEKLEAHREEKKQWQLLQELVGRNNGAAFRNFALALSLRELIRHANEQLQHIAPRYHLLQRFDDDGIPIIDFEIRDHDFSDQIRPITNISGGERFQISLAMALGLASLSRSVLPIETLLIDEGFGTLDPATLDKAISTLEALYQRSGARVALISHVERLRERLPVQIHVQKRGGGHSTLRTQGDWSA